MKQIIQLFSIVALITANSLYAHDNHSNHSYVGSHGMALLNPAENQWFAYHMALYTPPHDYQIVYRVDVPADIKAVLPKRGLVTILPDQHFDLMMMVHGDKFSVPASFYAGHFERGGKLIAQGELVLQQRKYSTQIAHSAHSKLDSIKVDNQLELFIYRIQPSPSFDMLFFAPLQEHKYQQVNDCVDHVNLAASTPPKQQLEACLKAPVSYFETQDFAG